MYLLILKGVMQKALNVREVKLIAINIIFGQG